MAPNVDEIFIGGPDRVVGAIKSAAKGTALPTTIAATASGFSDAGYVDQSGLKLIQATTWGIVQDWGGDIVRRFLQQFQGTLSWNYLEINPVSVGVFFGAANVTSRAATGSAGVQMDISINSQEPPRQSFVFDMKDGLTKKARIVVPDGQPTDRGEMDFTRQGALMLPVTLTTYPDALGNNLYVYTDDGIFTGTSVPTILSVLPSAAAVGTLVQITGSKFTGVTGAAGVKFNAVNATNYVVNNDGLITATMPAGSAGSAPVIVTNGAGASAPFAYTRGA